MSEPTTSGHLHEIATGPLRPTCPCHPPAVALCPECFVCHVGACPEDLEAAEYDSPGAAHWIDPDHPPQRLAVDAMPRLDAVRARPEMVQTVGDLLRSCAIADGDAHARLASRVESLQLGVEDADRLAAVRAVLGERHTMASYSACCQQCHVAWPCLHERLRRAVEGE